MKKKRSVITIIVLLALCLLAVFVFRKKGGNASVDKEAQNFKFEDTAKITRIFMADKNGGKVTLTRKNNEWFVNDKYPARKDAITILLETIKQAEVRSNVPKSLKQTTLRLMSSRAIKTEIYVDDELVKQYYVGHESYDHEGSYMILTNPETGENYPDPYIVHIPGFVGFLNTRYFVSEDEWRDRLVLNYVPAQIRQIKMELLESPDSSFTINLKNINAISLLDAKGNNVSYDSNRMRQYLSYFQNVSYETLFTKSVPQLADSLARQGNPYIRMVITDNFNISKIYSFYHRSPQPGRTNESGVLYKYDPERCFMRFAKDQEWAMIQYYVFGKILANISYFTPPATVKK